MVSVEQSAIELTEAQETILEELLSIHKRNDGDPVKGKEIASVIGRNPGTIRTQMQSLKSLQLVNGIPGPKGGYEPTARAYEALDVDRSGQETVVPLQQDGSLIEGPIVTELDFPNLNCSDGREAELFLEGSVHPLKEGHSITVGPITPSNLVISGEIDGVDGSDNVCLFTIETVSLDGEANDSET